MQVSGQRRHARRKSKEERETSAGCEVNQGCVEGEAYDKIFSEQVIGICPGRLRRNVWNKEAIRCTVYF